MRKILSLKKLSLVCSLFLAIAIVFTGTTVFADMSGTNNTTGYKFVIDDQADYFTDSEEDILVEELKETTKYCNVMIVTTESHMYSTTQDFSYASIDNTFGRNASSVCFVIDRDKSEIYLCSTGSARKKITNSKCDVICDNTYIYATESHNRDYFTCAYKTIDQVNTVLGGGIIAQPMKFISSAFIAVALGMLLCFLYALKTSQMKKASNNDILSGIYSQIKIQDARATFSHQTKQYTPRNSSSGGSHGGGRSGGGGGHSGGGHRI